MVEWTLDDAAIESYITGFYGHGQYDAKYWFIGMEFGGGDSVAEIVGRIQGWYDRGGHELEDLGGRGGIGGSWWFRDHPPLQPTWAKLIRVALTAEGQTPATEQIRNYQRDRLGRKGGLECMLELLPLPSPRLDRWQFYPQHSKLPYLRYRETYTAHVAPMRVAHLRKRIAEHRPGTVIFYGSGYEQQWRDISGTDFKPSGIDKVSVARNEHTLFVSMQHPTAYGLGNAYFDAVGQLIPTYTRG